MTPRSPGLLPLSLPCQDTGGTEGQERRSPSRELLLIPAQLTYHRLPSASVSITSSARPPLPLQCSDTQSSHVRCCPHTTLAEILSPLSCPAPRHQSPTSPLLERLNLSWLPSQPSARCREEQPARMRSAEEGVPMPDGEGSTLVKMWCSPQGFGCSEASSDQQVPKLYVVCFYTEFPFQL